MLGSELEPEEHGSLRGGSPVFPVRALALDLSGRCNLNCGYCIETANQPERAPMDPEVLYAAIAFLTRVAEDQTWMIHLVSGEALLNRPLIYLLEQQLARRINPAIVLLTTNGTCIDRPLAQWLADIGWQIRVSLDGPAEIQNSWRPLRGGGGTYGRVVAALEWLAQVCPERLRVSAVITHGSELDKVFSSIAALGIRHIDLVPVAHHDVGIQLDCTDVARYNLFLAEYVRRLCEDDDVPPTLVRFARAVRRTVGLGNIIISCFAGRSLVAVDSAGRLYPCQRFVGLDSYRIGDLQGGVDESLAHRFCEGIGRTYSKRAACSVCSVAEQCGGPCFANALMYGPGNGEPVAIHCEYARVDVDWANRFVQAASNGRIERFLTAVPT